jgi:hypothetical protein
MDGENQCATFDLHDENDSGAWLRFHEDDATDLLGASERVGRESEVQHENLEVRTGPERVEI